MKSLHTKHTNLLQQSEFKAALLFEARYALAIKGGYLPYNIKKPQEIRLVSNINLLNSEERKQIIEKFPLFSN
jgi:hypothetical protein